MKKGNRAAAQDEKKKDRQYKQQLRRARAIRKYGDEDWKNDWKKFSEQLSGLGLTIKDVAGDGNCMFRAIADQMEGLPNNHDHYRQRICDYIERNEEDYAPFVEDDRTLAQHVAEMRRIGTWGGHMELQAASMMLGINFCIHQLAQPRWEIANHVGRPRSPVRVLHLSYHDGDHYASVRNASEDANYSGPPTLITLPTSTGATIASSSASGSGNASSSDSMWQEEMVLRSTVATNPYFVRAVLLEVDGDTDAAIEYIIALASDGTLEESFQNEFAYEHGIFPEGGFATAEGSSAGALPPVTLDSDAYFGEFDPSLLKFAADVDDEFLLAQALSMSESSSSSGREVSKKSGAKRKESKNDFKGVAKSKKAEAASSSSAPSGAGVTHPKLERFNQQHMTNKQRNAAKRMEREKPPVAAQVPTPTDPTDGSVPVDLGTLRI